MTPALERLAHDVRSKCASLRDAANLLAEAGDQERRVLLEMMATQANSLMVGLQAHLSGFESEKVDKTSVF